MCLLKLIGAFLASLRRSYYIGAGHGGMVTCFRYGGIFSIASQALRNVYLHEDMDSGPLTGSF